MRRRSLAQPALAIIAATANTISSAPPRARSVTASRAVRLTSTALVSLAALAGCSAEGALLAPAEEGPRGPAADVTIVRDDRGVPHVYGASDRDVMFGAGWAMARDRLLHMELYRRQARGTLAELFGERSYRSDVSSRLVDFRRLGEADARRTEAEAPGDYALVEAWAEGINARLADVRAEREPRPFGFGAGELDFVPEDWTADDGFVVGKMLAFGLSDSLDPTILASALLALAPDASEALGLLRPAVDAYSTQAPDPDQGPPLPPPGPREPEGMGGAPPPAPHPWLESLEGRALPEHAFRTFGGARAGSNNWAIVGDKTDTGRPYVAGDPHQGHQVPPKLYPLHLSSLDAGGTLDVAGFAFTGTPVVELGHNRHVGWTATVNFADAMDVYDVPYTGGTVLVGGEEAPIVRRDERIRVRAEGAPTFEGEDRVLTYEDVPGWGVLLPDDALPVPTPLLAQGRLLFVWTGMRPTTEGSAYLALDRAGSLDEALDALDLLGVGAQNFVLGDASSIAWKVHAEIPDRGDPSARPMPWRIVSGDDADVTWKGGDLPPEAFPFERDPARGFVWTANNDPLGFTADDDVENDPYYYGAFYDPGFRAHRAGTELASLVARGDVTRGELEALQHDVRSTMADTLVPLLLDAWGALGDDPALEGFVPHPALVAMVGDLGLWDRTMRRASREAHVFVVFEWLAAQRALEAPLSSALFHAIADASPPYALAGLAKVVTGRAHDPQFFAPQGVRRLLLEAANDTLAWADTRHGGYDAVPAYESFAFARFSSLYGGEQQIPIVPVDGSADTLNVAESSFFDGDGQPRERVVTGSGALYRMVIGWDTDGRIQATLSYAGGAADDPASPYFEDQLDAWVDLRHEPFWFHPEDVRAHAVDEVVLPAAR